jgi:hypothetical protein
VSLRGLRTLRQFEADSKSYLPMIIAGQNNLLDLLQYRSDFKDTRGSVRSRLGEKVRCARVNLESQPLPGLQNARRQKGGWRHVFTT